MKIQRERLLEIIKEEVEWARQARPQIEEEVSPWQKLAGMIQESPQVDPETGKYPPPADIPDEPSIPRSVHLDIIEYLEDMSGLTMKGRLSSPVGKSILTKDSREVFFLILRSW